MILFDLTLLIYLFICRHVQLLPVSSCWWCFGPGLTVLASLQVLFTLPSSSALFSVGPSQMVFTSKRCSIVEKVTFLSAIIMI